MSLTTLKEVLEYNQLEKDEYISNRKRIQNVIRYQNNDQNQIVTHISKCKWDLNYYKTSLGNLNLESLGNVMENHYFNYDFMEIVRCIINSFLVSDPEIHQWITDLQSHTGESSEGYIFFARLRKIINFLVIKTPRPYNNLIHELFVGLLGTNSLRQYIPNFAYLYSFYKCSPPFLSLNENMSVLTWCHDHPPLTEYLFYERIPTTLSFFDYLKEITFEGFLRVYLQVLFALQVAGREIQFTHYDLHTDNILLRNPPPSLAGRQFYIPLYYDGDVKGKKVYILADQIATFIDYGYSRMIYKEKVYASGLITINDRIYFPLQDAYYLLLRSMDSLISSYKRHDLDEQILLLLSFFYQTSINDLSPYFEDIHNLVKVAYLPSHLSNIPISQLLTFIKDQFPVEYGKIVTDTPDRDIPIFDTKTLPINEINQILGFTSQPQFADIYDFNRAYNGKNKDTFPYWERKDGEVQRFISNITTLHKFYIDIYNYEYNLSTVTIDNVNINKYTEFLEHITLLYHQLLKTMYQFSVLYRVAGVYDDKNTIKILSKNYGYINGLITYFNDFHKLILAQYKSFYDDPRKKSKDIKEFLHIMEEFFDATYLIKNI